MSTTSEQPSDPSTLLRDQQEHINMKRRYSEKMELYISYCCNDCTGQFIRALVPFDCMICHKHTIPWTPFDAEVLRAQNPGAYSSDIRLC